MSSLVYSKVADIMSELKAIGKNQRNQLQGYNFRGIDDFYNAINPLLSKYGVLTIPTVLSDSHEFTETTNSKGKLVTVAHAFLEVKYTIVCAEDGSSFDAVVIGEGMDYSDKATNKAFSAAHKYLFIQLFVTPTEDTVDADMESPEMGKRQDKHFAEKEEKYRQKAKDMIADNWEILGEDTALDYQNRLAGTHGYDDIAALGKELSADIKRLVEGPPKTKKQKAEAMTEDQQEIF